MYHFNVCIEFAFDEILLVFVIEVIVRLPIESAFDQTLTNLLALVAVLLIMKYSVELVFLITRLLLFCYMIGLHHES